MANPTEPGGKRHVAFSIRTKLFMLVLVAFGLLIAIVVLKIGVEAGRNAEQAIDHSLKRSRDILERRLESRFVTIEQAARGIARDGRVFPEVYAGASPTLQDLSGEFEESLGCEILMFTNARGELLARSDNPSVVGANVAERSHLFRTALDGEPSQGLMVRRGELLQIVALPIFDNAAPDLVRGSIAMAYSCEDMIAEIKELSNSEIVMCTFASRKSEDDPVWPVMYRHTLGERANQLEAMLPAHAELWEALYDAKIPERQVLQLGGDVFHAAFFPLLRSDRAPVGFVMAMRSHTELVAPYRRIQHTAGLAGVFCLLAAILAAWYIARRITGPIIELVGTTEQIENGMYPTGKPSPRGDEVGLLSDSVHRMSDALRNKAALENYLVELAENFDLQETIDTDELALSQITGLTTDASQLTDADGQQTEMSTQAAATSRGRTTTQAEKTAGVGTTAYTRKERFDVQFLQSEELFAERYRMVRELGSGGMGTVYLAEDEQLKEPVAIKLILNPNVNEKLIDRFRQELRMARRITHQNVLRNHDLGVSQNLHFISMEYMPGVTLFDLIRKHGPLNLNMGIIMARQMCSAVAAAHSEGIVHRDLKPQNMMINKQGILKIMDFGIAASVEEEIASGRKQVTGTPHFMAPEQFAGNVDIRSDIYALGIILYFLFSGRLPFWEKTMEGFKNAHVYQEPPHLREKAPDAPESLDALVWKAMEKHPEDRFQSAREMQAVLASIPMETG